MSRISLVLVTAGCCVATACQSSLQSSAPAAALAAVGNAEPGPVAVPVIPSGPTDPIPTAVGATLTALDPGLDPSAVASPALGAGPLASSAQSQYPNLTKKLGLSLGVGAYSHFDTSLRVDTGTLVGAVVDLEETLGVDQSSTVARLDGFYRFNPRHQVDFSVYDISRSGVRMIEDDIQIGEILFPDGAAVTTKFDTSILKLDYRYNFVSDERTRIGASFGIHGMSFDIAFEGSSGSIEETFKAAVPLPVLGLHFEYALSPKWKLLSSVEILQLDLGAFGGVISDRRLTLEHDTFHNFGWGVGYNGFSLDADIEGEGNLESKINMEYQGVLLYLRWYF